MSLPLVKLEPHTSGDTWVGIPTIGPLLINGVPPEAAASRVRLTLSLVRSSVTSVATFDTVPADGVFPIVIGDAATWEFTIPPVPFEDFVLPPGNYEGQLEITDANGVRLTTHNLLLTITPDKTS